MRASTKPVTDNSDQPSAQPARTHRYLAARDEPLARFERWLALETRGGHRAGRARPGGTIRHVASPTPVTQSIGSRAKLRLPAARYAKQEITEAIKFLTWLHSAHHRTLATCQQQDVDEWLASGPTTRSKIRNLLAWAKKTRVNKSVQITHQQPPPSRALTQQQRLAWLRELLTAIPNHWLTVSPESFCCCSLSP